MTDQTEEALAAEAEAAEKAKAAAAAEAEAAEKAKAAAAAPKAAPKLSDADLRAAIAAIEGRNTDLHRAALLAELGRTKGAKIEDKANTYRVRLHGLEVTNTAGFAQALTVWCSKARRLMLGGGAE